MGNLVEAVKLGEQAVALDPLDTDSLGCSLDTSCMWRVGYPEAQIEVRKALDLSPQAPFAHFTLGLILLFEEKSKDALAETEKEPSEWARLTTEVLVYHALGREQDSNAVLVELIAKHHTDSAFQIAQAYAYRGESDKSFEWLERAYKQRDTGLTKIKTDPLLKYLHQDRRYPELLKKMHLPI